MFEDRHGHIDVSRAINICTANNIELRIQTIDELGRRIDSPIHDITGIPGWNDRTDTTLETVLNTLEQKATR